MIGLTNFLVVGTHPLVPLLEKGNHYTCLYSKGTVPDVPTMLQRYVNQDNLTTSRTLEVRGLSHPPLVRYWPGDIQSISSTTRLHSVEVRSCPPAMEEPVDGLPLSHSELQARISSVLIGSLFPLPPQTPPKPVFASVTTWAADRLACLVAVCCLSSPSKVSHAL